MKRFPLQELFYATVIAIYAQEDGKSNESDAVYENLQMVINNRPL